MNNSLKWILSAGVAGVIIFSLVEIIRKLITPTGEMTSSVDNEIDEKIEVKPQFPFFYSGKWANDLYEVLNSSFSILGRDRCKMLKAAYIELDNVQLIEVAKFYQKEFSKSLLSDLKAIWGSGCTFVEEYDSLLISRLEKIGAV